ncbi:MAG: glycosyltransferase [Oscillospiraceae bacterium]|nr:glycosyltransferase [Oscillospiraceae bacterium]
MDKTGGILNKEKNFVSAVVYLRNDEQRAGDFLRALARVLSDNFLSFEIICVNDACTDGTIAAVKAAIGGDVVTSIVHMSHYQGPEAAMNAGIDLAIGDFVFEFESVSMDYDPGLIMEVYRKALTGYDIVSAAPKGRGKLSSRLFYLLFNRYARVQYALFGESFRVLSRRAINRVHAISKTIPYRKAVYASCGLKVGSIQYPKKGAARSKNAGAKRRELAVNSLILFTDLGFSLAKWLTAIMILMTLFFGGYTVAVYLSASPVPGWTTTMLLISAGFFGLFSILTVIIKYLSILTNLVFIQQKYIIEGIEKL